MTLLALHGISKAFGGRQILRGLDLELPHGARTGLVGPNGSGKSTLLRICVGLEESDAGTITRQRGLKLAMLAQHPLGDERTPADTLRDARDDLREIDAGLAECNAQLADPSVYNDATRMEAVLHRQATLLDRYERAGGPSFEGRVRAMLADVGLDERELTLPTRVLSGGQRKLIGLAAAIVQDPQLLLLDEPEAHLDLEGRERLEWLMTRFAGGILVVSHDRYLLDETVTAIASLDAGQIRVWPGNYTAYAVARELELKRQQETFMAQRKEIERLEEASRRLIQWARSVPASQSNKGLMNAARNLQRRVERMDKIERPVLERRRIGLELHPHQRGGKRAAELRDLVVAFDEHQVLVGVDVTVMHGERVGVVGLNGAGKSVMLKTLVGQIAPTEGEVWVGPSIRIGYLAQDQDTLNPKLTPIETLRTTYPGTEEQAVSRLMAFLFDYEQVRRPIQTLSGGERTRLQLLLLMLSGANLLVLDEPTNHLDIESIEALESSLEAFEGTAVFISHDRYFLDRMADRVVEVRDGDARSWLGGYSEWLARRDSATEPLAARSSIGS
ncbi:MAG TPA: ABC-F family ATP-binding cassette domain-containing protein [Candidatus Limnocylindria bacterium]|nr:ABC-F family ATP-binding cassette domain-containing protein [Candidatus Limnocylindria bacterium]